MTVDFDDMGKSHDIRMELEKLKEINPAFKVTLFAIPADMTIELLTWADDNDYWVELGQHGWTHEPNTECQNWTYEECSLALHRAAPFFKTRLFKAPGWVISDGCYNALKEFDYIVADQSYNDHRRPEGLRVYKGHDLLENYHGHTWDCGCNNGIHEDWDNIVEKVKNATDFQFISEVAK